MSAAGMLRLGSGLAMCALLMVGAPVAIGATGFASSGSFTAPAGFGPIGVAVNNTASPLAGTIYVADFSGGAVDRFSPSGEWEEVTASLLGASPYQLTIDQNAGAHEGDVLVAGDATGVVYRFDPSLVLKEEISGLTEPHGVAVNTAERLFVAQADGTVHEFDSSGSPIDAEGKATTANTVIEGLPGAEAIAASGSNDLYIATDAGTFHYALSGGAYHQVGETLDPSQATGVAFTAAGDVLTDLGSQFLDYEPSGTQIGRGGSGTLQSGFGLAVNTKTHDVYAADLATGVVDVFEEGSTPSTPVTGAAHFTKPTAASISGTLGAETTAYYFAYNQGAGCEGGSATEQLPSTGGAVEATITNLEPFKLYAYCLVAVNAFGSTVGSSQTFETGSFPPEVSTEGFRQVTANTAELTAEVESHGIAGRYYFEYSPIGGQPRTTAPVAYPAEVGAVAASARIIELLPSTDYLFRIVVENVEKETEGGPAETFMTLAAPTAMLPDERVYEKVTPSQNFDADVYVPRAVFGQEAELANGVPAKFPFQVALGGDAISYPADPTPGGFGEGGSGLGNQYLARRSSQGGWAQSLIQPPAHQATYYQGFSSDLGVGILNSGSYAEPLFAPLVADAPGEGYSVLYARSNAGSYETFFTLKPMRAPEVFGTRGVYATGKHEPVPVFAGGSEDFSSKLFEANDALLSGEAPLATELRNDVKAEIEAGENKNYLYDLVGSQLSLVDILPNGKVEPNATFGGLPLAKTEKNPPDFQGAISDDGQRVFWTDLNTGVIYARIANSSTVQVSSEAAQYWTSAADGRYVFYTENGQLYRFDSRENAHEPLTSGAGVVGVLGVGADGEGVYAVSEAILGSGKSTAGAEAHAGEPNLYLLRHDSEPLFIATLSLADGESVEPFNTILTERELFGDWQTGLGHKTAEVSLDGQSLVFMSNQILQTAGYPHGVPNPGHVDEIYTFNATSGQLACISCSSSGEAPPRGLAGAAAFLPVSWSDTYLPQWMADEGNRVFFDSEVPLVAGDTNEGQDVYEWEREGVGGCPARAGGSSGGCVYLLSSGSGKASSWFAGSSASGDDAFIVTRSQLAFEDGNGAFDLYDARVDGQKPVLPPACTGTGCQGVPAPPPTFATPPSATFEGVGNFTAERTSKPKPKPKALTRAQKLRKALAACHKSKNKRTQCERNARRRYASKPKKVSKKKGRR